jgi:hypothetical protein
MWWRLFRGAACLTVGSVCTSCAFLPGFSLLEDPATYAFSVSDVANQVSCELQDFMATQIADQKHRKYDDPDKYRWVLDEGDVSVHLSLQTDTQGYVNFTGVNLAQVGLTSLATFIAAQSKVPTLGAKLTGKRTRTMQVDFTVSPKPLTLPKGKHSTKTTSSKTLSSPTQPPYDCTHFTPTNNPLTRLYLKEWLDNYFEHINYDLRNKAIPEQLKIQSVELSTAIFLAVDVSGGATPNVLGNGSTFIIPINGLSLDYNPDYQNKIDMTMNICDNSVTSEAENNPCFANDSSNTNLPLGLLRTQCLIYAYLQPLLSGVKPPKDISLNSETHATCSKKGFYIRRPNVSPTL